jgi:hypothetical protein
MVYSLKIKKILVGRTHPLDDPPTCGDMGIAQRSHPAPEERAAFAAARSACFLAKKLSEANPCFSPVLEAE